MILAGGILSEPPLAMLLDRLDELGAPVVVLDQRALVDGGIAWRLRGGRIDGWIELDGKRHDLGRFDAVFLRLMDHRLLPEIERASPDSPVKRRCQAVHEGLIAWSDLAPGRVVNRYRAMGSNGSKPYQAQIIKRSGFRVPDTLVTSDPALVRAFVARHERVVYKSISGVRSIVTGFSLADDDRLDAIRACPVQFQAYVPGFDVRVHTIGEVAIGTRVDSPGTDYRYTDHGADGTALAPYELSPGLASHCVRLAAALGLAFAGIDLRVTPNGEVYCFEVNPSPAYSYYEAHTGQPISLTLARFLDMRDRS